MCEGRDLARLPVHTEYRVLQLISEVGTDLTKWPTEKHFTAWEQRHCTGWLLPTRRPGGGGLIAYIALARKLAGLFWRVMVKGLWTTSKKDWLATRPR